MLEKKKKKKRNIFLSKETQACAHMHLKLILQLKIFQN